MFNTLLGVKLAYDEMVLEPNQKESGIEYGGECGGPIYVYYPPDITPESWKKLEASIIHFQQMLEGYIAKTK